MVLQPESKTEEARQVLISVAIIVNFCQISRIALWEDIIAKIPAETLEIDILIEEADIIGPQVTPASLNTRYVGNLVILL